MAGPADHPGDGRLRRHRRTRRVHHGTSTWPARSARSVNDVPGTDDSGPAVQHDDRQAQHHPRPDASPEARAVLDDLVRWADVLVESFSPRGNASPRARLRSGVASLNPTLIMMSSCLFGQTRPAAPSTPASARWAPRSPASSTSPAGRTGPPCGPFGAYSDYLSPRFALCALLAALDHRRRTGEGQYLDFAQAESAVHFLTPALLDHTVNGRRQTADGNADPDMAPHGVYPSAGDDRWVAIACRDDADWRALAGAARPPRPRRPVGDRAADPPRRAGRVRRRVDAPRATGRGADTLVAARRAGPRRAELRRMRRRPTARPPAATSSPAPRRARHDRRRGQPHHPLAPPRPRPSRHHRCSAQDTVDVLTELLGYDDERLGELFAAEALD